uniref:Uncharacterized protein n=1 Tax=Populus trichocarpa TaxID=3694 RepID=A0A3N7GXH6_POPTR
MTSARRLESQPQLEIAGRFQAIHEYGFGGPKHNCR